MKHPYLNSSKSFGAMLMHLFQALGKEDPLEIFFGGADTPEVDAAAERGPMVQRSLQRLMQW